MSYLYLKYLIWSSGWRLRISIGRSWWTCRNNDRIRRSSALIWVSFPPSGGRKQQRTDDGSATVSDVSEGLLGCENVLFTAAVPDTHAPVHQRRFTVLLHTFYSFVKGSLYETSNLDRGGNNRKKKIEEFSKSSREKLVQSKNRMFSKFTSILQHAVEAVSLVLNTDIYPEPCLLPV